MAGDLPFFQSAPCFQGARPGTVFKLGHLGLGYYVDAAAEQADDQLQELRPKLPERWRGCSSLRQERLKVDPKAGAGLALEHCDFGFKVSNVDESPGQPLQAGEVIVAMEGRLFVGLSAAQLQASFLKRRVDGARLQVASLQEIEYLSQLDPAIVECWDAQHQRVYYFHKKTGQSGWTREDLQPSASSSSAAGGSGSSASAAAGGAAKAPPPVDLATFLSHGFGKPKEPQPGKAKKRKKEEAAGPVKDESDLAREERQRWADWNKGVEGGVKGGYTEQFFMKYKNCQSNPPKEKDDKRLKGSIGPGQGMEYMARWTGSNNSFN